MELSKQQKEKIKKYLKIYGDRFKAELNDGEGKRDRQERISMFQKILSQDHLPLLTEKEFSSLISQLWASLFWGNKEYLTKKILSNNGIDQIRTSLIKLLYEGSSIAERYDSFRESIKGLGSSSITEIMTCVDPEKYSLWNEKPKNVLPLMMLEALSSLRVFKFPINGKVIEKCHQVVILLRNEI